MRAFTLAVALSLPLAAAPQESGDAAEFQKKILTKLLGAKSLKWKATCATDQEGPALAFEIVVRGPKYRLQVSVSGRGQDETKTIVCDGERTSTDGAPPVAAGKDEAAELVRSLVRKGTLASLMGFIEGRALEIEVSDLRLENEKLGEREVKALTWTAAMKDGPRDPLTVKMMYDAATLELVGGRSFVADQFEMKETIEGFAFDAEIPDATFALPKHDPVKEAASSRTRVALEHYAMWNGAWPASLADLVKRPESATIWPAGGYLSEAPALDYSAGKLEGRALVQRIENVEGLSIELLTTRYRLAQLRAALWARLAAGGGPPESLKDLGLPVEDGWGRAFDYERGDVLARIASRGPVAGPDTEPTDAQRKRAEALVAAMKSVDIEERDAAEREMAGLPPKLIREVAAKSEGEVRQRLTAILDRMARLAEALPTVPAALVYLKLGGRPSRASNERNASATLKTITTAQADFRSNDRDENLANDFWVGDVSGLWRIQGTGGAIKLIEPSAAEADAEPLDLKFMTARSSPVPVPKAGYLFRTVRLRRSKDGLVRLGGKDGLREAVRFAFLAVPAEYGVTGLPTFFVSEENVIWRKDTGGDPFVIAPERPTEEGWVRMD